MFPPIEGKRSHVVITTRAKEQKTFELYGASGLLKLTLWFLDKSCPGRGDTRFLHFHGLKFRARLGYGYAMLPQCLRHTVCPSVEYLKFQELFLRFL